MGVTAAVISAVAAVGSGVAQHKATKAQVKAQRREASIQQRAAAIENQRQARRAIAARRLQQAEMIQGTEAMGARASSATAGAVGSLTTQTAANIGAANTNLAANVGMNNALIRGARKSARFGTIASTFEGIGAIASVGGNYVQGRRDEQARLEAIERLNRPMP